MTGMCPIIQRQAQPHEKYYFPAGTDIFQVCAFLPKHCKFLTQGKVQHTLYKLHRQVLMGVSTVFNDMFITGRPPPGFETINGQSDMYLIVLETIKAEDFNHLLSWLYPHK